MKRYAPLATLVSVVLLGVGLLVANMLSTPTRPTPPAAAPAASAATGQAAATPAPAAPAPSPAAPEPAPPAAPVVAEKAFTGRTAGNEVTVAIAVKDGKAAAYVCNPKRNIEAWFDGTLAGEDLTLEGANGTLTATMSGKATLGAVVVDGAEWPFAAQGLASPAGVGTGGRSSVADVAARVGWIVEGTR